MTCCWPSGPPAIGATAELSRTVAPDDIDRFTQISGDRNPLHYDADAAKASRLGGIVVQGGNDRRGGEPHPHGQDHHQGNESALHQRMPHGPAPV